MGSQDQMTHEDLWHWLTDFDVPRTEIDKKPMRALLDLQNQSIRPGDIKANISSNNDGVE